MSKTINMNDGNPFIKKLNLKNHYNYLKVTLQQIGPYNISRFMYFVFVFHSNHSLGTICNNLNIRLHDSVTGYDHFPEYVQIDNIMNDIILKGLLKG